MSDSNIINILDRLKFLDEGDIYIHNEDNVIDASQKFSERKVNAAVNRMVEFQKSLLSFASDFKTPRERELGLLRQLQDDLVEAKQEFTRVKKVYQVTENQLDRDLYWKMLKGISDKIRGILKGIAMRKALVENLT